MGECDPPFNLEEWVPNSFDIIAVGVEECMSPFSPPLSPRASGPGDACQRRHRQRLCLLHGEGGQYAQGGRFPRIHRGDGTVNHSSRSQVFIRIDLIQCGLVPVAKILTKNVALGKNLVVTRASNKGGVRVRCPLELGALGLEPAMSTQIDFICCHLASDQKGKTKIAKRNKNAV